MPGMSFSTAPDLLMRVNSACMLTKCNGLQAFLSVVTFMGRSVAGTYDLRAILYATFDSLQVCLLRNSLVQGKVKASGPAINVKASCCALCLEAIVEDAFFLS